MSFLLENTEIILGEQQLVIAQQSLGSMNAARWLAEEGFEQPPTITEIDGFEDAIRFAEDERSLLLLSSIDHPYVGDIELHSNWRSLTSLVFVVPVDLEHKTAHPTWHSFKYEA